MRLLPTFGWLRALWLILLRVLTPTRAVAHSAPTHGAHTLRLTVRSCQVVVCPCHGFADNYRCVIWSAVRTALTCILLFLCLRRAFSSWYIPHLLFFITFTSIWFWVSVGGYVRCAPLKARAKALRA